MSKMNPRIVIEDRESGVRVKIHGAYSRDHALFMLAQAMGVMLLPEQKEGESNENVQELSDATIEKKEADVSKLQ